MSDRLTRKEIKQHDSFQTTVEHALEYAEGHRRNLMFGIAGVLGLAVVVGLVVLYLGNAEKRAQTSLGEAIRLSLAPIATPPPPGSDLPNFATEAERRQKAKEAFEATRSEYGSSDAAAVAGIYLARIALDESQPDRARALWQEYLDDHPKGLLAASVKLSLLGLDRSQGKAEQVAKELEALLAQTDRVLPVDAVLYELGVTLEQLGRGDEAKSRFQRIIDEFPESTYQTAARERAGSVAQPLQPV